VTRDIAPCPFCGGQARVGGPFQFVICTNEDCKAVGPNGKNEDDCVDKWNVRATEDKRVAEVIQSTGSLLAAAAQSEGEVQTKLRALLDTERDLRSRAAEDCLRAEDERDEMERRYTGAKQQLDAALVRLSQVQAALDMERMGKTPLGKPAPFLGHNQTLAKAVTVTQQELMDRLAVYAQQAKNAKGT
jgi:hypothetical protein